MKKHIIIFAAAITPFAFFSCSKEGVQPQQLSTAEPPQIQKHAPMPIVDLQKDLDGRFEFNGNVLDQTGQLKAKLWNSRYKLAYTADRKGTPNAAIEYNGPVGLVIDDVPQDTSVSVSVWVRSEFYPTNGNVPFVEGAGSLAFEQFENTYQASTWNGTYLLSGPIDRNWHHLVVTRDANSLKFYIDGNLVGNSPLPAGAFGYGPTSQFIIAFGWNAGYQYWKGAMDNLCFYRRTLSWADVQALYKQ